MSAALGAAVAAWRDLSAPRPACLIIVRHGATAWNLQQRIQGHIDIPLDISGQHQAVKSANAISRLAGLTAIYTSPLQRARATAQAIATQCQVPLYEEGDLIERSLGCLEGMTREQREEWQQSHPQKATVGVEPWSELQYRADSVFTRLTTAHVGEIIVAVSHGALINAFLHAASTGQVGTGITNLANGGICVIWRGTRNWHLAAVNLTEHLSYINRQTL